jgi:hypothetical protein
LPTKDVINGKKRSERQKNKKEIKTKKIEKERKPKKYFFCVLNSFDNIFMFFLYTFHCKNLIVHRRSSNKQKTARVEISDHTHERGREAKGDGVSTNYFLPGTRAS